jgi:hypothetical protein
MFLVGRSVLTVAFEGGTGTTDAFLAGEVGLIGSLG